MEVQQLRIGNYIQTNNFSSNEHPGTIRKVSGINYDCIDLACGTTQYLKDVEPIPLKEEILLKCGFYKTKVIFHHDYFWSGSLNDNGLNYPNLEVTMKYLHQLQNLYFTLTGKELEINL